MSMIDRWYYAPTPALRLAVMRVLVSGFAVAYMVINANAFASVAFYPATRFEPVGIVGLVLAHPLPAGVAIALHVLAVAAGLGFALGFKYRILGPLFAVLFAWVATYRNSFGMIFHTENLVVMHVAILALAPAADVWSVDAGRDARRADHGRYGWALRAMAMVAVVAYVLAGVAKLRNAGLEWGSGEILQTHVAYDNLRKIELGDIHAPLGVVMLRHAWLFPILSWMTLVLEIGAFAALLGPRLGRAWAAAMWSFHVGVLATMAIAFAYPLSGIAFACFFPVERIVEHRAVRRILGRLLPAPARSGPAPATKSGESSSA